MIERELTVSNRLGLHARATAKLVQLLSAYKSNATLTAKGREVNAKSIMGVMLLAAGQGAQVRLRVDGEDEATVADVGACARAPAARAGRGRGAHRSRCGPGRTATPACGDRQRPQRNPCDARTPARRACARGRRVPRPAYPAARRPRTAAWSRRPASHRPLHRR